MRQRHQVLLLLPWTELPTRVETVRLSSRRITSSITTS
jgi:hypothetical protein